MICCPIVKKDFLEIGIACILAIIGFGGGSFIEYIMYMQDMSKEYFLDSVFAEKMYPDGDIHTIFIAEIEKVYAKID